MSYNTKKSSSSSSSAAANQALLANPGRSLADVDAYYHHQGVKPCDVFIMSRNELIDVIQKHIEVHEKKSGAKAQSRISDLESKYADALSDIEDWRAKLQREVSQSWEPKYKAMQEERDSLLGEIFNLNRQHEAEMKELELKLQKDAKTSASTATMNTKVIIKKEPALTSAATSTSPPKTASDAFQVYQADPPNRLEKLPRRSLISLT